MDALKRSVMALCCSFFLLGSAHAQQATSYRMGTMKEFTGTYSKAGKKGSATPTLKVGEKEFTLKINFDGNKENEYRVVGEILEGAKSGTFFYSGTRNGLQGHIIFFDAKEAYKIYSDEIGDVFIKPAKVSDFMCVGAAEDHTPEAERKAADAKYDGSPVSPAPPSYSSKPGARGVIYLDFDGENIASGGRWANGSAWYAQPLGFSDAKIKDIWTVMSEDYRPFDINVTTDRATYDAANRYRRIMCVWTSTQPAGSGGGGTYFYNAFNDGDNNSPALAFLTGDKSAAEVGSHECGHSFNLMHDGGGGDGEYWEGHGDYSVIMGNGYYLPIVQFSKGEYSGANNFEDDLSIITNSKNDVGYRTDDHGNTTATATLIDEASGTIDPAKYNGIIEKTTDKDYFEFTTSGGSVKIDFQSGMSGVHYSAPDLDIQARLLNENGTEVVKSDPTGLDASISTTVQAGTYYIEIDGVGAGNPSTTGYSDYGSLGYYEMSGSFPPGNNNNPPEILSVNINPNCNTYTFDASVKNTVDAVLWDFGDNTTSTIHTPIPSPERTP
ncbi:MAG: pre-peptidase C-terminal domain-containing protein [Flavobacteriales bacterium]|nr:pre-peptidase C-terminal domain-containing protein [Flavobacteriales bacterium]